MKKLYTFLALVFVAFLSLIVGCGQITAETGAGTVPTVIAEVPDEDSVEIAGTLESKTPESNLISVNAAELLDTWPLPGNISVSLENNMIEYPSEITLLDEVELIDFSEDAADICAVLLGEDYESDEDGTYTLSAGDNLSTLHLSTALLFSTNSVNGKGSNVLTEIIDYTSSLHDSLDAQKNDTLRSYYADNDEIDGLPLQGVIESVTDILTQLGIPNVEPVYTAALTSGVMQQRLEAFLAAKREYWGNDATFLEEYGMYQDISFSTDDECYMIIFRLRSGDLYTMTGNENTAETALAGTEIRCLFGRNGLINLYCNYVPDISAATEVTVETISLEDALSIFMEEYVAWHTREMKILSIDLEYVVQRTIADDDTIKFFYVPAWVICTEYHKNFVSENEKVSYTYHDYFGIHAGSGSVLTLNG